MNNGWTLEKKITIGLLLQLVFCGALIVGGYAVLQSTVATNEALIRANSERIAANTARIEDILTKMSAVYVPRQELEGIKLDDRWGVIFSPYDLSCALEHHESPQCRGYVQEDAKKIAINVILYSINH